MNKQRRSQIAQIISKMDDLKVELEQIRDDEQESFDNIPENMQQSERASSSESAISELDDAIDNLDSSISSLQNIE